MVSVSLSAGVPVCLTVCMASLFVSSGLSVCLSLLACCLSARPSVRLSNPFIETQNLHNISITNC